MNNDIKFLDIEWRCSWSSADRRCSNYIWVIDNFVAYLGASYIRCFTVSVISGLWQFFLMIWEWFLIFCEVITRKNIVEEIESFRGARAEWSSPSWVCVPQKSLDVACDFWNTNSFWRTPFDRGVHDGLCVQNANLSLVQIMACHYFSAKPLSEPVLVYNWLDPRMRTNINGIWIKLK